ncbi:centrosome-associated protein 350-like [Schistocerca cancellata]|uniref:centrosome-associated protein 350-like n=1 Tax=Schistocerca cancellata TaxID=274614 RepID=UPI002119A102|nr:centrosome-associated protein 350-like [Schistocerca cancellata]
MTAVRQKLLALKVSDAKVETKTGNICTDRTLAGDDKSGIEGNNKSALDQNKEVCTSGFWVEENAIVQTNTVAPARENKKKVQAVQLCSSKENSLSNAEGRSGNRKTSGSDKSYVFSEQAGWIENEEPEQKGIGSLHLSTVNKTNITQHSRNQGKTHESSAKSSIVGSDKELSLTSSLKNNSESLSLPDVHLVRKRRSSENETVSIPSNSKEPYLSGVKERENSLPTSKADWIEASVHLSSPQTSFPSETSTRTKNNENETHYKKNITETKSDHSAKDSNNSKETMSRIDISDGGHAEKSSIQCTGTPLETETKKTGSCHSGSSANWSRNRHKFHKVLESGKMGEREQQVQVTSNHQQQRAPKQDKIDDFEKNRREFNAVIESMRKCATLSGVDPEIIDWLTFSDVSSPVKESNTEVRFEKQEKELFQTEKNVLNNSENNSFGENREMQNVKYSYDSSFTSVSEDISGQTNSTKSKHSKLNSLSDSTVTKILDAALKKGQISIAAYCKYAKLIQEEEMRAHEQDILLDTTEQALLDRFKTDMMSLEINKRQLKRCGKENLVPSVKKKQRALVLKLEHDREEIKRLRNTYMEASKEWRNLLLQHLNLAKCNVTDNKTLGTTLQERALTTATSISTEPGNPMNSETKKSVVPSTSPVQTEVSSSIQTELSQHSAQSTRSVGSGSWSSNQKKENSPVRSSVDVCTDLTKTETAAQTNSAESRHSLLPSKRLWSHDEISNWEQSPGEDKTRVRPFRYHRDHSISPMRVLKTEKQNINLSGSADFLHMENNSATTCFDRDFISGKNSSSARAVPVKGSNNKNSSASQETAETVSSAEVLCKGSDASIRMSVSPQSGMRRQSSGSDESVMLSQGDTPSEQSDLEGRVSALREQLRRRELEAEQLKKLQRKKARREELKATEQSLLKQIQALDSYINRIKEQLTQNFNTSPVLAVKPKIKQPRVQTEQICKHILGRTKEKSEPCKQTERKSNQVLDKVEYESPLDDSSQKSISNGLSTEIPTVISEQTANSVKFLPEDTNSITFREAHTSEDDNHQDDIVSVSGSYERTEGPDSTEDYISQEKNSYSKNKNAIIKTSSMKEISSLSSEQQCLGYVKHTKSEQSFSARELNDGESIIPTMLASGDDFVEEDREISEILVNSTFDMINAEVSSTQQCKGSKNDYTQESCVSSSFKPLENSSEAKSNNLFSERSDSSLNNVVPHRTVSKSCTSATINEELSEIEETSVSVQQISDTTEVQKASSAVSIQHEISAKSDLESENVVNVTDLVCAPQNVGDTFCILTSDIKAMNASPSILAAGEEKREDSTQELLLSTESRNQPSEKELSEESVLNVYSHTNQGKDGIEFCHSADDSICTESHPMSVQLSSTFVVEREEHTPEAQTVEQSKITVGSEKNENKMQKLKLVDSITESIMLQLLKDSFVSPDIKLKECGEVPDGNASRETVLSYAHKFSETTKPEVGVISEIQCDSRTVILDEAEKQENLAIEKEPLTINDICIGNTTFIIDESSKSEKNTSVLVDEMLNHFLENATSDVLTIYNAKISNSDRLCVPSEDSKQSPSIKILESRDNSDLSPPDRDSICKPSEIINVTLKNNNTHLSVDDMINNDVVKDSFHNSKKINVIENEMQDMISFTSPDSRKVQELSVEDVLKPFSEHSTCEKLMTRTDREQPHENRSDDVSSGSLITDEGDSLLHHGLTTADEVVMSEEHLANGCKSKVGTQNGNKLKDISHLQKVEVRGKQTLNNETFPPGWFDEDLDLSNSWREAEQLRLQQLHIEQEIRRLEEQQHQQQALVLVREIPDKPPPPYTPRGTTLLSSSVLCPPPAIGASAPRHRLIELVAEATPLLISTGTLPVLPPEDFCTGYNPSIRKFIFDLSSSLVNEAVSVPCPDDEYGEETPRQQMTVKRSQEAVRAHVTRRATALLDGSAGAGSGSAGKLRRLAVGPRWRRRDHVDELLVREARDEEPGWIDYRRDEAQLRNETACALLHDLLDDTVTAITTAIARRMAPKTTGVM